MQFVHPSNFTDSEKICYAKFYLKKETSLSIPKTSDALFGTFYHRFIKYISSLSRDDKNSYKKINHLWDAKIKELQEKHDYFDLNHIKKLRSIKNHLFKSILRSKIVDDRAKKDTSAHREKYIEYNGIKAYIDYLYVDDEDISIGDLKTGNIFDQNKQIKIEYQNQLYIYAAMYYGRHNIFPNKLFICDNKLNKYYLDIPEKKLALGLLEKLIEQNKDIQKINSIEDSQNYINLDLENCNYCDGRLSCKSYWDSSLSKERKYPDLKGIIKKKYRSHNGNCIEILDDLDSNKKRVEQISKYYMNIINENDNCLILNLYYNENNDSYKFSEYSSIVKGRSRRALGN